MWGGVARITQQFGPPEIPAICNIQKSPLKPKVKLRTAKIPYRTVYDEAMIMVMMMMMMIIIIIIIMRRRRWRRRRLRRRRRRRRRR